MIIMSETGPTQKASLEVFRGTLENQFPIKDWNETLLINDSITKYGREVLEPINATLTKCGLSLIDIEAIRYGVFTYCRDSDTFHGAETSAKANIAVYGIEKIIQKLLVGKINDFVEEGRSLDQLIGKGLSPDIKDKLLQITDAQITPTEKTLKITKVILNSNQ